MALLILFLVTIAFTSAECCHELSSPILSWREKIFALVEVDQEATAYNQLVKRKDVVTFSVNWTADMTCEVFSQALLTGSIADIEVKKGGQYRMDVELCNANGCSPGNPAEIVVADTDGSHLPLENFNIGVNNKPFMQTSGKIIGAYYVEWTVYSWKYPVSRIPVTYLTHLLYGYIAICPASEDNDDVRKSCIGSEDFQVTISDIWGAVKKPLQTPSSSKEYYKGNYVELMKIKQGNPDLSILASIGGWGLSDPYFFLNDKSKRDRFTASVKEFLQTWKFFDGIVIDWEFPGGNGRNHSLGSLNDGETYVSIMKELREMLNELSSKRNKKYELTSVIGADCDKIKVVNYTEAQKYIDYMFLKSYDYKGPWLKSGLGHQTPLYAPAWNPNDTYTIDSAVKCILAQGVDSKKVVVGVAMYGVRWRDVRGYTNNNPFTGTASGLDTSIWESHTMDYSEIANSIAQGKWKYHYDNIAKAPYIFNEKTKELISYDDKTSVMEKANYVINNNLAGLCAYKLDSDNGDILKAMNEELGNRW